MNRRSLDFQQERSAESSSASLSRYIANITQEALTPMKAEDYPFAKELIIDTEGQPILDARIYDARIDPAHSWDRAWGFTI